MLEQWKDIPGYNGAYRISNLGRVIGQSGKLMKPKVSRGYEQVTCYATDHSIHTFNIHRLVASLFIPNPDCLPQVDHINEEKRDNRVDNLRWCTAKQNINYGTRNERVSLHNHGAMPVFAIPKSGHRYWFKSQAAAIRGLGLTQRGVWCCLHGSQKTTRGFAFTFAE